jgi:hypothetical protein
MQSMQLPGCDAQMTDFLKCAAAQPAGRWECDEGAPSLKEGACDAEQAKVAGCLGVGKR